MSKSIPGQDWTNGTTLWRVTYEYADPEGGGERVDYFKTANRYTLPTEGRNGVSSFFHGMRPAK
jgi:hypothetical protein